MPRPIAGQQIQPQPLNLQPYSAPPPLFATPSLSSAASPGCQEGRGEHCLLAGRGMLKWNSCCPVAFPCESAWARCRCFCISDTVPGLHTAAFRAELTPAFGSIFKGDTTAFSPLIPHPQRPRLAASVVEGGSVSRQHREELIVPSFRLMQPGPKRWHRSQKAGNAVAAPAGPGPGSPGRLRAHGGHVLPSAGRAGPSRAAGARSDSRRSSLSCADAGLRGAR